MQLELSTPALLFPAIAILMLGYVNRYLGIAGVIRNFKKDYDAGYIHIEIVEQLKVLQRRIELSQMMLIAGVFALICSCLSMLLIFKGYTRAGEIAFGAALLAMLYSLFVSVYETALSNRSLMVEIHDIFTREQKKHK